MKAVRIAAPAKLNLGLEVIGRRSDGYHEIKTVLQTVSIVDQVTLTESAQFRVTAPGLDVDPEENLALDAARRIATALSTPPVWIDLQKAIPAAAGMGGASSDAAATLRASMSLWQVPLPSSEIASIAAHLGSDVPFFLKGGTALATGRGEQIRQLPPLPSVWFVVAVPNASIELKTARMYGQLCPADFSDGSAVDAIALSIASGKLPDWSSVPNAFVRALLEMRPDFHALHDAFGAAGAPFVAVTGAGVGHFTAVPNRERAEAIRAALTSRLRNHPRTFVCHPVETSPDPIVISRS